MQLWQEFKAFAMRGNVVDMAVGVIIGTAFSKIVSSLVSDICMPILGALVGQIDFKDLSLTLIPAAAGRDAVIIGYGAFLQTVFDFMIIAAAIFMAMKIITKLKRSLLKEEEAKQKAAAAPEIALLTEIRDLLKTQKQN